jgi:hypothetical protein
MLMDLEDGGVERLAAVREKSDRTGEYSVSRLIGEHGAGERLLDLVALLSRNCPKRIRSFTDLELNNATTSRCELVTLLSVGNGSPWLLNGTVSGESRSVQILDFIEPPPLSPTSLWEPRGSAE